MLRTRHSRRAHAGRADARCKGAAARRVPPLTASVLSMSGAWVPSLAVMVIVPILHAEGEGSSAPNIDIRSWRAHRGRGVSCFPRPSLTYPNVWSSCRRRASALRLPPVISGTPEAATRHDEGRRHKRAHKQRAGRDVMAALEMFRMVVRLRRALRPGPSGQEQ